MFIERLSDFISRLESGENFNEWYLSDFIAENIYTLSSIDAFDFSSYIVNLIKVNIEVDYLYELLEILNALQIQSDTTQMPLALLDCPNLFNEILLSSTEDSIIYCVEKLIKIYS